MKNGRIIEFRELLWLTKEEKLTFRRIKKQELADIQLDTLVIVFSRLVML